MTDVPAGFLYIPDLLSGAEQGAVLAQVRGLEFTHDKFRGQRLKRGYAQFGYSYVSTGRKLTPAAEMPLFLREVLAKAQPHCPADAEFNQCIVTQYPPNSGIGWHTDAPKFGEYVLGVSLASAALFQLRRNGEEAVCSELEAAPGSMYLMQGPSRWDYQHQVVPVKTERYSLTFRPVPLES